MKTYQFETSVVPTTKDFWIDADETYTIEANNLNEALDRFYEEVEMNHYIDISKNAMKTKQPMYIDDKEGNAIQVGYVIKGSTEVDFSDYGSDYRKKYVDIWTTITEINNVNFVDELIGINF